VVNFVVMGSGNTIELMTESRQHCYIIRIVKDQPITRIVNLSPVTQFPKSNIARTLGDCYKSVALDIEKLLRLPFDGMEYRALWWEIKRKTEKF